MCIHPRNNWKVPWILFFFSFSRVGPQTVFARSLWTEIRNCISNCGNHLSLIICSHRNLLQQAFKRTLVVKYYFVDHLFNVFWTKLYARCSFIWNLQVYYIFKLLIACLLDMLANFLFFSFSWIQLQMKAICSFHYLSTK